MALTKVGKEGITGISNSSDATAITIDSSERVGIGEASPAALLHISTGASTTTEIRLTSNNTGSGSGDRGRIAVHSSRNDGTAYEAGRIDIDRSSGTEDKAHILFSTNNGSGVAEKMRVLSDGALTVSSDADTSPWTNSGNDPASVINYANIGLASFARSGGDPLAVNRTSDDGDVVSIYQDGSFEGSLRVSGSTVSLVGGHLCRWSQTSDGSKDTSIVRGTVMTNLNEMCEWKQVSFNYVTTDDEGNETTIPKKIGYGGDADVGQTVTVQFQGSDVTGTVVAEDNEQLNRMAVSSVEGDVNVSGVMDSWDEDDDNYDDMTIAMTGDFVIRIAQGTTVARGDLLMSAGDGTAKTQEDDIVRSKSVAKVTSTTKSHTYDDGSYLVPCVLMAC